VGSISSSRTDDSALLPRLRLTAPRRCTKCDLLSLKRNSAPPQCRRAAQRLRTRGSAQGRGAGWPAACGEWPSGPQHAQPAQLQPAQVDNRGTVALGRPRADHAAELEVHKHIAAPKARQRLTLRYSASAYGRLPPAGRREALHGATGSSWRAHCRARSARAGSTAPARAAAASRRIAANARACACAQADRRLSAPVGR
jgi:hypothetical protein